MTISYASGQWFETEIWEKFHSSVSSENQLYRVMMSYDPGSDPWIFFSEGRGGSWKNWDNSMFLWIGDHLMLLGVMLASAVAFLWWVCLPARARRRWTPGMLRAPNPTWETHIDKEADEQ